MCGCELRVMCVQGDYFLYVQVVVRAHMHIYARSYVRVCNRTTQVAQRQHLKAKTKKTLTLKFT